MKMTSRQLLGCSKKLLFSWRNNQYQFINRCLSTKPLARGLECLKTRSLLQVSGAEVSDFLQGLITNDMKHFDDGVGNIYTVFLNTKGRILFDTIIYKGLEDNNYLIECDTSVVNNLQKHLIMYKLRRKVNITSLADKMKVWALFDANFSHEHAEEVIKDSKSQLKGQLFPCDSFIEDNDNQSKKLTGDVVIYKDPRIPDFSHRILSQSNVTEVDVIKRLNPVISVAKDSSSYREFLYKLGIGEGAEDLPPGKPLPLEANCDYLHGVSFHKGCYIGQELTARTHHTGVVRKRLMPLKFDELPEDLKFNYDDNIVNENDKPVGKLRGIAGQYGLGLMRIAETVSAESIKLSNVGVKTARPQWWPLESRFDKITSVKN